MMNTLFRNLIASGDLTVYMDDMAIHTSPRDGETHEEHLERHRRIVNEVLAILEQNSLFLNIDKCEFEQPHIDFLGIHVENNQMKMEDAKIDRVLPLLHPGVLGHCPTAARPYQAGDSLALERAAATSIRYPQGANVRQARPATTRLRENVLSANQRLSVQGRGHPISRRGNNDIQLAQLQASPTPYCVLLQHLHPHGTKLRHLRARILGGC